ncbi:MAG: hypothetical protein WCJ59_00350 [bacterium]
MVKKPVLLFVGIIALSILFTVKTVEAAVCTSETTGKTPDELQAILDQCEKEIADQKTILTSTKQQSSLLEKNIADLNYKINKSQLEIKARNVKILQLGDNITSKKVYIGQLSDRLINIRESISKLVRNSGVLEDFTLTEVLLSNQNLSDFMADADRYAEINKQLRDLSLELKGVKVESEDQKKQLESKQLSEQKLKYEQEAEKKKTEKYKVEKQSLLKFTKGQETAYAKEIAEKERVRNEIQNRIFRTVGGQEIKFGDALKLIQPYESTIGVSPALVLAVLFQESSVNGIIGKNIGKCTYNQSSSCISGKTVMSDSQKPAFLSIMSSLGINPDSQQISCAICRDGSYGGAMGPAQFMPVTWNAITSRITRVLGVANPSPFVNLHAFTASALLLKDNQDRCKTAFTTKKDIWACAASKYYGGLGLSGSRLLSYMRTGYGAQVAKRALQFEKDIDLLDN